MIVVLAVHVLTHVHVRLYVARSVRPRLYVTRARPAAGARARSIRRRTPVRIRWRAARARGEGSHAGSAPCWRGLDRERHCTPRSIRRYSQHVVVFVESSLLLQQACDWQRLRCPGLPQAEIPVYRTHVPGAVRVCCAAFLAGVDDTNSTDDNRDMETQQVFDDCLGAL